MRQVSSRGDLYGYLASLSAALKQRGLKDMGEMVDCAIAQAAMVTSEFPGEARFALRRILKDENGALTDEERITMAGVVRQLDEWFDKP